MTLDEAWQIIEYYERRWLIEEYHKAIKTGCDSSRGNTWTPIDSKRSRASPAC